MPSLPRLVALEVVQDSLPNLGLCTVTARRRTHMTYFALQRGVHWMQDICLPVKEHDME